MAHQLPKLPYELDALGNNYPKSTMDIHYGKHHQAYVDKLNAALEGTGMENLAIEELMTKVKNIPEAKRQAVINNGGGHYNHSLFWMIMGPNAGGNPVGTVAAKINEAFGSFDEFKKKFADAAATQFGSGWAWLTVKTDGSVQIEKSANQDNCLMESDRKPIMVIDVWEHAYYLQHQNRRPEWIETFFSLVNWQQVETNYNNAINKKTIVNADQLVAA